MVTRRQLIKNKRLNKKKRSTKTPALGYCPQKKGVCLRIFCINPKKPNSALRRVAKIELCNTRVVFAHIPGIGHNLQRHGAVLVRGGRVRDLPGMKYRIIREKHDLDGIYVRRNGRSKYGAKLFK